MNFTSLEICAGGGGQALGLELAGFRHSGVVECEPQFCATLRKNRPLWNVIEHDIRELRWRDFHGVDLLAGGVPCPPFSIAGRQLGQEDERDMFPAALRLAELIQPRAVMFENVPGFASRRFDAYRRELLEKLSRLGWQPEFKVIESSKFGVPQLRPRFVLVALRPRDAEFFKWPQQAEAPKTVGEALADLMAENGWPGAEAWVRKAGRIAPTIVGGSKRHGGPDLGPTRAKRQWRELHVDGMGIADAPPDESFPRDAMPRLTVRMVARLQTFPDDWAFCGGKTASYRQVGNAFPPLAAKAIGQAIHDAFARVRRAEQRTAVPLQMRLLDGGESFKASKKPE